MVNLEVKGRGGGRWSQTAEMREKKRISRNYFFISFFFFSGTCRGILDCGGVEVSTMCVLSQLEG